MCTKSNFIISINNLSNTNFPLLQKESLFAIEDYVANKKGIYFLIKELIEFDDDECSIILQKFCSIPEYINIIYKENSPVLNLHQFVNIVMDDIFSLLSINECNDYFIICSQIIGLLFRKGHTNMLCEYLNDKFILNMNFLMTFTKILNSMSMKYFENVYMNLLLLIKSNDCMKYICQTISNPALDSKILFICQKMLFFQYYDNNCIAINLSLLISRLSHDEQISLLKEVIVLWSDEKSMMKVSFNQHFFLSKMFLLIFFNFAAENREVFFVGDNLSFFLRGISLHLMQPLKKYSLTGMVIAEILSKYCSYKSESSLNFEYTDTEETITLKSLVNIEIRIPEVSAKLENIENDYNTESEDSDFEPIETCFDKENPLIKRPYYVRDCFEGLSKTKPEDREYFVICLDNVENLICNCPEASIEEAIEFSRLLLHLHIEYEVESFTEKRRSGLVALCSLAPIKVSKYLTNEFFNEKNSLDVRFNILQVITKSAQKLSGFNDLLQPTNQITSDIDSNLPSVNKSKTRYFFKRHNKPMVCSHNLFNECASCFFYQLLNGINIDNSFDLLNFDDQLLCRYIYTLGIIVYCSVHSVGFTAMISEYFLFLKSLRSYELVSVKEAVQVCLGISLIGLSGASGSCLDDLVPCLREWQLWLTNANNIVTFEMDSDCSSLMRKNLFLIRDVSIDASNLLFP